MVAVGVGLRCLGVLVAVGGVLRLWGCGALLLLLLLLRFLLRCSSPLPMAWGIPLRRLLRSRRSKLLGTNGRIERLATGATSRVALAAMGSRRGTGAIRRAAETVRGTGATRRAAVMGVIRRVVLVVMAMRVRAMVALAEMAARVQVTGVTRRMGEMVRVMVVTSRVVPGAMAILVVTGSLRAMKVQAARVASRVAEIVRAMATSKTAAQVQAARAATRKTETVRPTATPRPPRRHRRLLLRELTPQRIPGPIRLRRSSQRLHSTSRHQYPLPRIALVLSTAINTPQPAL